MRRSGRKVSTFFGIFFFLLISTSFGLYAASAVYCGHQTCEIIHPPPPNQRTRLLIDILVLSHRNAIDRAQHRLHPVRRHCILLEYAFRIGSLCRNIQLVHHRVTPVRPTGRCVEKRTSAQPEFPLSVDIETHGIRSIAPLG